MPERGKFFDDLAGVAGGAMSALAGLRDEAESTVRARVEEVIRKLDLVRREDLEAVQEMAANARAAQVVLEARVAALEAKLSSGASASSSSSASAVADGVTSAVAFGGAASGSERPRPESGGPIGGPDPIA